MFATLGEIVFDVLTSPEALKLTSEYTYAEHKLVEAAPRLQWISNSLRKLELELRFHVQFTSPQTQINRLAAAAQDHQARALVLANGIHKGYFVIENIEETDEHLADDGSYIYIMARLELREWVPGADFDPQAPARSSTPSPGIVRATPNTTTTTAPAPTKAVAAAAGQAGTPYDPSQPVSPHNLRPTAAILQLSSAGAGPGVSYSTVPYSKPGVSGVTTAPAVNQDAADYANVPSKTIVRSPS